MEVAADFEDPDTLFRPFRLMEEKQTVQRVAVEGPAAGIFRNLGIVVAGDPDPVVPVGQAAQMSGRRPGHAVAAAGIVKTVAQADDPVRRMAGQHRLHPLERGGAVPGRQEGAALGVGGALFEMQVGEHDGPPLRQDQRTGTVEQRRFAAE